MLDGVFFRFNIDLNHIRKHRYMNTEFLNFPQSLTTQL